MAQSEAREIYSDEYSRLRAHGAVNETEMGGHELVSRREGERKGEGSGRNKRESVCEREGVRVGVKRRGVKVHVPARLPMPWRS